MIEIEFVGDFLDKWYVRKCEIVTRLGSRIHYLDQEGRWRPPLTIEQSKFNASIEFDTKEAAEIALAKSLLLEQGDGC